MLLAFLLMAFSVICNVMVVALLGQGCSPGAGPRAPALVSTDDVLHGHVFKCLHPISNEDVCQPLRLYILTRPVNMALLLKEELPSMSTEDAKTVVKGLIKNGVLNWNPWSEDKAKMFATCDTGALAAYVGEVAGRPATEFNGDHAATVKRIIEAVIKGLKKRLPHLTNATASSSLSR